MGVDPRGFERNHAGCPETGVGEVGYGKATGNTNF